MDEIMLSQPLIDKACRLRKGIELQTSKVLIMLEVKALCRTCIDQAALATANISGTMLPGFDFEKAIYRAMGVEEEEGKEALRPKPPMGIKPKKIWMEERLQELLCAMERRIESVIGKDDLALKWLSDAEELFKQICSE